MFLVTGANGQLGKSMMKCLQHNQEKCIGIDIQQLDLTDSCSTREYIDKLKPNYIIHCAGYTQVDKAEENNNERKRCIEVNYDVTVNLIDICKDREIKLVYISTDYVFDGRKDGIYEIEDSTNPLSLYGKTKEMSEIEILKKMEKYFIVRTSWLFGEDGKNFVTTILKQSKNNDELKVVNDQIGSPTYTSDLAKSIYLLCKSNKYGKYQITNSGFCSWKDFAAEIVGINGVKCKIVGIPSEEYDTIAERPRNSRLSKKAYLDLGFPKLPRWEEALKEYLVKNIEWREN